MIPLRVLLVEDSELDAALIVRELGKAEYSPVYARVESAESMSDALDREKWDIILCDYAIPGFGGLEAIKLLQDKGLDIPLIVVSGTIGEDIATAAMRAGAYDYIMKDRLKRLVPAIKRELSEAEIRRQKRRADTQLQRANRALLTLTKCNEAIIRADSEEALLQNVCEIIVNTGGYRMCWLGYAVEDDNKTVLPVGWAGYEDEYLKTVNISWADNDRGNGPTGKAIRMGKPIVARQILTDPSYQPWREEALKRGYKSSISLPLIKDSHTFGVLNIYASEPEALDIDEVELLNGLANDLAYGILSLRTREERDQAETDLRTLANKLVQTQEEERRHIARELHDETGSYLTILKLLIHRSATSIGEKAPAELAEAEGMLKELMGQVRNLSLSLRPGMLDDLGLLPALQWYLEDYSKKTGIRVESSFKGLQRNLSQEMRTAAYRIVQEALTNVLRYAKTNQVTVIAQADDDKIYLQITDAGAGFDPLSIPSNSSGIRGIKERTRALGGKCRVDSAPGKGTRISVEIPLPLPETTGPAQPQ